MRKTLYKVAALSVCLGLLLIAVPNANAVQKKPPKLNFLRSTIQAIDSIVPFFTSIFDSGTNSQDQMKTKKKVKLTGTLSLDKISDGD